MSKVLELKDDRVTCEAVIAPDSPWVSAGACPAFVAVEAAAQAAALLGEARSEPQSGTLVRARTIVCSRSTLTAGVPFVVTARRSGAAAPLFVFDVEARDGDGLILDGQIGIYLGEDAPSSGHISEKQNH